MYIKQVLSIILSVMFAFNANASANESRIKDIADIEGVRTNALIGYGLVVGLAGTGDSSNSVPFTVQSMVNMLEKFGVNSRADLDSIRMENVAAVMITAELPSFARQGSKLDIVVSSLGDAESLEGGQLLATPLIAADGNTYAIAQGALVVGGFQAKSGSDSVSKNHLTSAKIADGGTVERELGFDLKQLKQLRFILRNPDFTTALRIKDKINESFKEEIAKATDNATVDVQIPTRYKNYLVSAIDKIQNLKVVPDSVAKVVVDEKTGTIVLGEDVKISRIAISHANLTIRVSSITDVSQPKAPFAGGETKVVKNQDIEVEEKVGKFKEVGSNVSLSDLIEGLNALGVSPRDTISILQSIKASGALQAEIKLI
ncbi:MAG TPA: flagellar biosynthesis protein FlgA [Alphaproteobacteria bacterium]|nr:flagellar biosynthesis protein FlgA [Alphaproteobacteria bacterium]